MYTKTSFSVSSPPQCQSRAVVCVSTPRMYPQSGYFLVSLRFYCSSNSIIAKTLAKLLKLLSYFRPILGVLHEHMTLIWCLSPLIGFFLTPILGSLSDRCRSNLGRRRPFIIFLSIGVIIGKCTSTFHLQIKWLY